MTYFKTEDQKKKIDAYVAKMVAEAPPLSPEISMRIAALLYGGRSTTLPAPERPEVIARRKAKEALAKVRGEFQDAMSGCHGCGLGRKVHAYQQGYATGYHDFVDLSPDGAIKVAQVYKKKIAAAERAVEEACAQ